MESLSYTFEGRGLLFTDDTNFQVDGLVRSRNLLNKCDKEPLSLPPQDAIDTIGFVPDMMRKSVLGNQCLESSVDDMGDHSSNLFSTENSVLSSLEPSVSAKRARITNLPAQIPTCQVFGCNKDLSSSKEYHKRHKVCDVHSKTAVVIVNSIKQRFCQQCSRFHILAEFDEGKRSCRKRLAGHNERRRKPQFDTHLGSAYFTTNPSKATSLLFSGVLPGGFFGLQCNEPTNRSMHLKMENEPSQASQLALHMRFSSQSLPQSVLRLHSNNMGKHYPSKNCLNAPLVSLPELSASSNPSHAPSLLSVQSDNVSGMSMATHPFPCKENYHSSLYAFENQESNEVSQESNGLNLTSYLSTEGANTVDLIELSLHLHRVEEQKYHEQIKLENGVFCQSTTT